MMQVNKQAVAAAFSKAAKTYSQYDKLQRCSAQKLITLLNMRNFTTVLDAGCGPGSNSLFWRKNGSIVTALDLSEEMLKKAREKKAADNYLVADIESLPIEEGKFDLVWSHLAVQWCTNLSHALTNLYRVARSGGKVAFTTLLDNSLYELNQAWKSVDKKSHVNHFLTQNVVENVLSVWRYKSYIQSITLYFDNARNAMQSLKGVGATHLHKKDSKRFITRKQLQCIENSWPKKKDRYYPLTYHLFYGIIDRE